ncbi:hypothetical protein [Streptomyces litchfieldiae]|uniref:Uncharacterized protein n=1 Tax=Streptomyces litchfieldiae TaxID=3075543 RepID=A0ABU2N258_9ACTN|nr:hypothetical protein [Streptomyces sp. DSM 44938]MDT0347138.1 hypothetical protein [Streptomyces sp. DSM 44938]
MHMPANESNSGACCLTLSERITAFIAREFDEPRRVKLLEAISDFDGSVFGGQDRERMAAAVVLLFAQGVHLDVIMNVAQRDWRDLLMHAGLAHHDWPGVLTEKFGPPPG